MPSQLQSIRKFAKELKKDYPDLKACYIAVMPNDASYDLEVEVSDDEIGGVFDTGWPTTKTGLEKARKDADSLDRELAKFGIKVMPTRKAWACHLDDLAEEWENS